MPPEQVVDGWDTWVAGPRRSIFYPSVQPVDGPGRITSVLGGLCDGLPGPDVSVDPGDLVSERARRLLWVDLGSPAHLSGWPYIREPGGRGGVGRLRPPG